MLTLMEQAEATWLCIGTCAHPGMQMHISASKQSRTALSSCTSSVVAELHSLAQGHLKDSFHRLFKDGVKPLTTIPTLIC